MSKDEKLLNDLIELRNDVHSEGLGGQEIIKWWLSANSAEKGLNFPNNNQDIPILTEKDLKDLEFIAKNADIIGISFVRKSDDIVLLHEELIKILGEKELKNKVIMAKIETVEGVNSLPEIIVEGASKTPFTIMIA